MLSADIFYTQFGTRSLSKLFDTLKVYIAEIIFFKKLSLRCLIVTLSLSHWYPGSGVVLDCIDS